MKKKAFVVHIETESCSDHYFVFDKKPSEKDLLKYKKDIYRNEWQEDPDTSEDYNDLVSIRNIEEVEIIS